MVAPGSAGRARPRGRPGRRQDTAEQARSPGRGRGDIAGLLLEQPRAALLPQAAAVPADRDDMAVVQQAVEDRRRHHRVAERVTMPPSLIAWSVAPGLPAGRSARRAA